MPEPQTQAKASGKPLAVGINSSGWPVITWPIQSAKPTAFTPSAKQVAATMTEMIRVSA